MRLEFRLQAAGTRLAHGRLKAELQTSTVFRSAPSAALTGLASRAQSAAMKRIWLASLTSIALAHALAGAPLERWVYAPVNLQVAAETDRLEALLRRARPLGFSHFLLADSKFARLDDLPRHYFTNLTRIRSVAHELDVELTPAVFPVGYSNDLLWHDPNLAEGLPVREALFVVSNGVAAIVADPPVTLPALGEPRRWGFIDPGWQSDDGGLRVRDPRGANARVMVRVRVSPFRQYHVAVRLRTEDFRGQPEIKALTTDGRSLCWTGLGAKPTQEWRTHHVTFNSLAETNVGIYIGAWGATSGSLWLASPMIEECGPVNVLRRDGAPLRVQVEGGADLREGADFEPLRDARLGNQPWSGEYEVWHEPPALRVKRPDGTRLRVSYFHPHVVYEGQVCACVSEPRLAELLRQQATTMHRAWSAHSYLMSHDEWRVLGWDAACERRGLTPGQIVAENARQCAAFLRSVNPGGRILVWSDMFDPQHNAVAKYYLVNGDLRGAWEGLERDVMVMNWNFGKRTESLRFFAERGHQQILAGYYDAGPKQIGQWLEAARDVPGVIGVMYTTWQRNYADLEAFAEVVTTHERQRPK